MTVVDYWESARAVRDGAFIWDHVRSPVSDEVYLCADESQRRADVILEILEGNWARLAIDETGTRISPKEVVDHLSALRFAERVAWLLDSLAECERAGARRTDCGIHLALLSGASSPYATTPSPSITCSTSSQQARDLSGRWVEDLRGGSTRGSKATRRHPVARLVDPSSAIIAHHVLGELLKEPSGVVSGQDLLAQGISHASSPLRAVDSAYHSFKRSLPGALRYIEFRRSPRAQSAHVRLLKKPK